MYGMRVICQLLYHFGLKEMSKVNVILLCYKSYWTVHASIQWLLAKIDKRARLSILLLGRTHQHFSVSHRSRPTLRESRAG